MDLLWLDQKFGDRLSYMGGIDVGDMGRYDFFGNPFGSAHDIGAISGMTSDIYPPLPRSVDLRLNFGKRPGWKV